MVVVVVVAGVEGTILVFVFKNDATSSFGSFFSLILSPYSENFFLLALDSRKYIYIYIYMDVYEYGCIYRLFQEVYHVIHTDARSFLLRWCFVWHRWAKPPTKRFLSLGVVDECGMVTTTRRTVTYTTFSCTNLQWVLVLPLKKM